MPSLTISYHAVGDFNIANNTFGDCNMEDDSYGIGGPEYNGCAKASHSARHLCLVKGRQQSVISDVCHKDPCPPEGISNLASCGRWAFVSLQEIQEHIVRFCSINPYYIKCHTPPSYYGEELIDELRSVVLRCDSNIKVQPKQSISGKRRRKRTTKARMPRTRVARTSSASQTGDGSSENY